MHGSKFYKSQMKFRYIWFYIVYGYHKDPLTKKFKKYILKDLYLEYIKNSQE